MVFCFPYDKGLIYLSKPNGVRDASAWNVLANNFKATIHYAGRDLAKKILTKDACIQLWGKSYEIQQGNRMITSSQANKGDKEARGGVILIFFLD